MAINKVNEQKSRKLKKQLQCDDSLCLQLQNSYKFRKGYFKGQEYEVIIRSTSVDLEGSIYDTEEKMQKKIYHSCKRLSAFFPSVVCVQKREMGERKKTREGGREGRQVRQREMEERSNASGKRKKEKKSISPLSQRPESAHQLFF